MEADQSGDTEDVLLPDDHSAGQVDNFTIKLLYCPNDMELKRGFGKIVFLVLNNDTSKTILLLNNLQSSQCSCVVPVFHITHEHNDNIDICFFHIGFQLDSD